MRLHGVGDHVAQPSPRGALGDRESPRPRSFVVRRPLSKLAQIANQIARHVPLLVDEHAGAATTDQVGQICRQHVG